jgi:hypothetical protein
MTTTSSIELYDQPAAFDEFEVPACDKTVEITAKANIEPLINESMYAHPPGAINLAFQVQEEKRTKTVDINIPLDSVQELIVVLQETMLHYSTKMIKLKDDRMTVMAAGFACFQDQIEELRIVSNYYEGWVDNRFESEKETYDIQWIAKKTTPNEADAILYEVKDQTDTPWKNPLDKMSFLRALVGGNHKNTSKIKVTFKGFPEEE